MRLGTKQLAGLVNLNIVNQLQKLLILNKHDYGSKFMEKSMFINMINRNGEHYLRMDMYR